MQENFDLTRAFISVALNEFVTGFFSGVRELTSTMKGEIDLYLSHYEPVNEMEYE